MTLRCSELFSVPPGVPQFLTAMDRPVLEKLILAKLSLPPDAERLIKKFLQVPTPTALLMKRVVVLHAYPHDWYLVQSPVLRNYEQHGRWTNPPLRPEIIISHRYRNEADYWYAEDSDDDFRDESPWRSRIFDSAGEPKGGRGYRSFVKLWEPQLDPDEDLEWSHVTPEGIERMSREARDLCPVSV